MFRVVTRNGRQVLSVPSRNTSAYLRIQNYGPMSDIHVVNQHNALGDQAELQENPEFNLHYSENAHMPFPPRPFMLGREGTPLAALRQKEQGDWNDLSAQEKEDLYRGFYDRTWADQHQGTDSWKGIMGIMMIFVACCMQVDYLLCHDVFGWEPKKASFWYWWSPGWQQMRKNEAAQHILWEYDNMGDQRDVQHWDYVNHEWKRPCMPRIDTSY